MTIHTDESTLDQPPSSAGPRSGWLEKVAITTAVITYVMVVLGSTVRVTDSGMGCPSWPLCFGHIGYVDRFHAILEQSHRYWATILTTAILVTAGGVERLRNAQWLKAVSGDSPTSWAPYVRLRRLTRFSFALIFVQVALGAITVFAHNAPVTVAIHLVAAFILLGTTTAIATSVVLLRRPHSSTKGPVRIGKLEWWALAMVLTTVATGTGVADSGFASHCKAWPTCPPGTPQGPMGAHLLHRMVAGITAVVVVALAYRASKTGRGRRWAIFAVALVGLEVAAGATVAIFGAPAVLQNVHLGIAGALWMSVVVVAVGSVPAVAVLDRPRSGTLAG